MPKPWKEMTVEEKLDDLHDAMQRLLELANASVGQGRQELAEIDRRLVVIERALQDLGTSARTLLERLGGSSGWSERP